MMSTQNQAEHGVILSSRALLQERFKQLQRVKEMREKKELLTIFSDSYKITSNPNPNPNPNPNNYETTVSHNTTTYDGDVVDANDDDEVQIFLPPNYYNNSRKPSCYSFSSSSLSSLSSKLSHHNRSYHNDNNNNLTEISLSLSPTAMSYTNNVTTTAGVAAERFRRAKFEASPLSTISARPSSCVSSAYKFEDSHVSDVDTTLHL